MKGKNILILLPDGGNRYLSKVYDDDWMREAGFLEEESRGTVEDLLKATQKETGGLIMVRQIEKISAIVDIMRDKGISQMPVVDNDGWIKGIITENKVLKALIHNEVTPQDSIEPLVDSSVEFVHLNDPIEKVTRLTAMGRTPLVVDAKKNGALLAIITTIDLLTFLER